jgi:succinylglutamate desuccinylase
VTLSQALIFGGTHGNEWTGIYAIKQEEKALNATFPELKISFIHANPEAFKINQRFKDEDLNRAFEFLDEKRKGYEHERARELKKLITEHPGFVLDLHTTTSNMGKTLILTRPDPVNFHIAQLVAKKVSGTKIILSPDPEQKYLVSQSSYGMMIEVGPVPQGVLSGMAYEDTLKLIKATLEALSDEKSIPEGEVEVYQEIEDVYYPLDHHQELSAYIHPDFQGTDFKQVLGKYFPFRDFSGADIEKEVAQPLYPIFINEAAYYPKKLAYSLCEKKTISYNASPL